MDADELAIERAKLELEQEKIAVEKQRVAQERELEMKKARWVAGAVIIPVVVAAATISFGIWNQNKTAKDNLVAKAIEVVMKAEDPDPGGVHGKAIQVSQILPKALPKNFGETFTVDQNTSPSPASQKELLKLILDHPSRRNEIIDMWVKLWPLDTTWAEKLRGDEGRWALEYTVSRHSASPRESAEFPTRVKNVVAMFGAEGHQNAQTKRKRGGWHFPYPCPAEIRL